MQIDRHRTHQWTVALPVALAILLLFHAPVFATGRIYIAVYNESGGSPGIWLAEDLNNDGDALDANESKLFATLPSPGYLDLVVDQNEVLYAISGVDRAIHKIHDINLDGDALDPGEVTVFRDSSALGLRLERPYSLTAQAVYDPKSGKTRTRLYVMDNALQLTARIEDLDGDGDAQGAEELCVLVRNSSTTPFTANRMEVDEVGRLVAVNPNTLAIARLNDMNEDCSTEEPDLNAKGCSPQASCGPLFFYNEFQTIYGPLPSDSDIDPFGIAISPGYGIFMSERRSQWVIHLLRDNNGDEDYIDSGERTLFYKGPDFGSPYEGSGYDLVWGNDSALYYGMVDPVLTHQTQVFRLKDSNGDGDALDPGEATTYANLTSYGNPVGIAAKPNVIFPKQILLNLTESSPKGPVLVVPDHVATPVALTVINRNTGTPVRNARVGAYALRGCLQVCPPNAMTDDQGNVTFTVARLSENYLGDVSETLLFRVFGDEVYLPVAASECTPAPVAEAGPAQNVSGGTSVTLDGSGSTGSGLIYCWTQTGGTDVGLSACPAGQSGEKIISFTAPNVSEDLTFMLRVANACDVIAKDEVTITVTKGDPIFTNFLVTPQEGSLGTQITISGSGFGTKKGRVLVGGVATQVISWSSETIVCLLKKAPTAGVRHNVEVLPKGTTPIIEQASFEVKLPVISPMGYSGLAGAQVTLIGNFFGTKKGKVYLEKNGASKSCKVISWADASITFVVPKKLALGTTYNLVIKNKIGTATAPDAFTSQ